MADFDGSTRGNHSMAQEALHQTTDHGAMTATPNDLRPRRLLLATRSPRRHLMLEEAGVGFEPIGAAVDDGPLTPGACSPRQWAAALAYLKAEAARRTLAPGADALVLGADTIVVAGDAIIGQPIDEADAESIVRRLSNGPHLVISGVALVDAATGRRLLLADEALVQVGRIEEASLRGYIESGEWRGKAGAYNLSERLEAGWPIEYEGDPATIMGLPMHRLLPILDLALAGRWWTDGEAAP
jgi:septum formation protein